MSLNRWQAARSAERFFRRILQITDLQSSHVHEEFSGFLNVKGGLLSHQSTKGIFSTVHYPGLPHVLSIHLFNLTPFTNSIIPSKRPITPSTIIRSPTISIGVGENQANEAKGEDGDDNPADKSFGNRRPSFAGTPKENDGSGKHP